MVQGQRSVSPSRQGSATLYTFLALLLLALALTLRMVAPYFLAILMGTILAIIAEGLYQNLLRKIARPRLSSLLVTAAVLLLILTPISAFVLVAVRQGVALGDWLSSTKGISYPSLMDQLSHLGPIRFWIGDDPVVLERQLRAWIQTAIASSTKSILSLAANLPALFFQVLLASLSCYFLLVDGNLFLGWVANKIPMDRDVRARLAESFRSTAVSVILASVISAAVQAVLMLISFFILAVPLGFLAAVATFIFAWIPIVGSSPIWIAAALYLYFQSSLTKVILMLVFGGIISISDNFVRPAVLGGRSSLHPLVTLVAIFGGIQMFGYLGIFVGPILMAILISLLQVWPDVALRFGLVLDGAPVPPSQAQLGEEPKSA